VIVSTEDYAYLRTGTWQSGLSREEVLRKFPDKRSWWIDSSGEVFDAGKDHQEFIKEHPELFDQNEIWTTYHAILKFWVRISVWGPSFTINSRNINQAQLDAAQNLYMREGGGKNVEFFQGNVIQTSFDGEEFLELKNVNQLKRMRVVSTSSPSDIMKEQHLEKRSWWVDPKGKVYDAGNNHTEWAKKHTELDVHSPGWIKVGFVFGQLTVSGKNQLLRKQVEVIQKLGRSVGNNLESVFIEVGNREGYIGVQDFFSADGYLGWVRNLISGPIGSRLTNSISDAVKETHPDKRSWWVNPDGKIFDAGHDHERFLAERPKTFGKWADINKALTLNWIRVAFWNGQYIVHCHSITNAQLAACQEIYKLLSDVRTIYISTLNKYGYASPHDFRWAGSQAELVRNLVGDPSGVRASYTGMYPIRRQANGLSRYWLVSPKGELISCGQNTDDCIAEHQGLFEGMGYQNVRSYKDLLDYGWGTIGDTQNDIYLNCKKVLPKHFDILKEMTLKSNAEEVHIAEISGGDTYFYREEFLKLGNVSDLRKKIIEKSTEPIEDSVEKSESFKGQHPDKRSWWINVSGDVYDAGYNHARFVQENLEMFDGLENMNAIMDTGWLVAGFWDGSFVIEGRNINGHQLQAAQKICRSIKGVRKIELFLEQRGAPLSLLEFLSAKSQTDLFKVMRTKFGSVTASSASEWMKRMLPDKRSWWIDPYGEVHDAGYDHDQFVIDHPEIFGTNDPSIVADFGWVRVGSMGKSFTVMAKSLSQKKLDAAQSLCREANKPYVIGYIGGAHARINKDEFLKANSVADFLKELRVRSGSRRAGSDERAWLISPEGEAHYCGFLHSTCGYNKKLLKIARRFDPKVDEGDVVNILQNNGWGRVGYFDDGDIAYLSTNYLTALVLRKFKEILSYLSVTDDTIVEVNDDDFLWKDFKFFDSIVDMNKALWRDREGSSRRRADGSERAWLLSPQGELINCEYDHNIYVRDNYEKLGIQPDEVRSVDTLVNRGWTKIGILARILYFECKRTTQVVLSEMQLLVLRSPSISDVQVIDQSLGGEALEISRDDFLQMKKPSDLRWMFNVNSSRRNRRATVQDRAWMISPEGQVIKCGDRHETCVINNSEFFDKPEYRAITVQRLVNDGWAKVGLFADVMYLECNEFKDKYFEFLYDVTMKLQPRFGVQVIVKKIPLEFRTSEFLRFSNKNQVLRYMTTGKRLGSALKYEGRAWLVSPEGQIIACGSNHERFVLDNREFFRKLGYGVISSYGLIKDGWARIGILSKYLYIECNRLTQKYFDILQDMALNIGFIDEVQVTVDDKNPLRFSRKEFSVLKNPAEVNRQILVSGRRASLPKSRNFLMGVDLESLSWPLRQAFDLLNLSGKKNKLSANQVASVFQANDGFLQDNIGRTSTELIRDLNSFFQYGSMQEQTA
jgi:hypothetical protein